MTINPPHLQYRPTTNLHSQTSNTTSKLSLLLLDDDQSTGMPSRHGAIIRNCRTTMKHTPSSSNPRTIRKLGLGCRTPDWSKEKKLPSSRFRVLLEADCLNLRSRGMPHHRLHLSHRRPPADPPDVLWPLRLSLILTLTLDH